MHINVRTFITVIAALSLTASACNCGNPNPDGGQPPTIDLQSPQEMTQLRSGDMVTLSATATDPEDGPLSGASVVWTSSISGQLATGDAATAALVDVGAHVITVTATDSGGQSASKSVNVKVVARDAPAVKILAPASGTTVDLKQKIAFKCDARAVDGSPIPDANITWTSALSGALPSGATMQTDLTVSGADTITCTATDPARNNASGSDSISITVSMQQGSTIAITQPNDAEIFVKPGGMGPFSNMVSFTATARDPNVGGGGGNLDAAIRWTLDPGNIALGMGPTATHTFADLGDFTVTATATDSGGFTITDVVTIHVVNNIPPQCDIQQPKNDGELFPLGSMQNLAGGCFDPETNSPLAPTWTTSAQTAALGTGFNITAAFTVLGTQTLSACAVDPTDMTLKGCAQRPVVVFTNTAPTACTISAPAANSTVNAGVPVSLTGSASDAEDPIGALTFDWSSDVDGGLGNGASTTTIDLTSPGTHILTLTVTDPFGLSCTATVSITVNGAPTVQIVSATQGPKDCLNGNCDAAVSVATAGTAMDPNGIAAYEWQSSMVGTFGTTASATLVSPPPGKHTLLFSATDTLGARGVAVRTIKLLPTGKANLIDPFANTGNDALSLTVDATGVVRFVDGQNADLFARTAGVTTNQGLNDVGLAAFTLGSGAAAVTFAGTDGEGLARCTIAGCTHYRDGPLAPSGNVVLSVAALSTPDVLFIGTDDGLVLTKASDPGLGGATAAGQRVLPGSKVNAIALSGTSTASEVTAWVGTDDGLHKLVLTVNAPFNPLTAMVTLTAHQTPAIPSNKVNAVAVDPAGMPWVGTDQGFAALGTPGPDLTAAPWNYPDDNVQAILFERRTIGTTVHDLVWAGTANGLIRYDAMLKIPTRFSTADGLGSNDILSLALDAGGVKYIGTVQGISRYDGP